MKPERNTGNPQGGLTGMVWVRMESFLSGMWAAMGEIYVEKSVERVNFVARGRGFGSLACAA